MSKILTALASVANHPLNRGKPKVLTTLSYISAQLRARLSSADVYSSFPNETRLLIPSRMKGAAHFINPGLCEFEEMCFVVHALREEDLFVDVGANVGSYAVLASGVAKSRTLAFEPVPFAFRYLVENVRLNALESLVTPYQIGIADSDGTLTFTDDLGTENFVAVASSKGVEVPVTSLDKVLAEYSPTVIKVDVEGFETKVFSGATKTLNCPSLTAMVVERAGNGSRYGFDERTIHERIEAHGFCPCTYSPIDRTLTRIANEGMGNIIYVRNFDAMQLHLRRAPAFRIKGRSI